MEGVELDICGDKSVLKVVKKEGEGNETPSVGDKVVCHYTGTLLDGTKFDSSRDRNSPFEFTIGSGVIQGWSDGVATMKKGEIADFTIASHKAYGPNGSPPKIPGDATLKFEIELLSFSDMTAVDDNGCILKKELDEGTGWKKPKDLANIIFSYDIKSEDGTSIEEISNKQYIIDEDELKFPLEVLVKSMKGGEKCKFRIKGESAAEFGQSIDSVLQGTATLISFENPKESWEMNDQPDEKAFESENMRESGKKSVFIKQV